METLYVLLYTSAPDVASKAPAHFPAHQQRLAAFHARGELLLVGAFGDPQAQGSMGIFTSREAAEEFVAGDPFRLNGVVAGWEVREWHQLFDLPVPDRRANFPDGISDRMARSTGVGGR
jgi:uncharacterized protein YciI